MRNHSIHGSSGGLANRAGALALALLLAFQASLPNYAFAEDAPRKKRSKYQRSQLTRDESEGVSDRRSLLLTTGEDKTVDVDFDVNSGTNAITIGNPTLVTTTLVKLGEKRQIVFKPLKAGETTKTAIKVGDSWVVVGVKKRDDAKPEEFDKQRATLVESALRDRREQVFDEFITAARRRLEEKGDIQINRDTLAQQGITLGETSIRDQRQGTPNDRPPTYGPDGGKVGEVAAVDAPARVRLGLVDLFA